MGKGILLQVKLAIVSHSAIIDGDCMQENAKWDQGLVFDVAKHATSLKIVPKQVLLEVKGLK